MPKETATMNDLFERGHTRDFLHELIKRFTGDLWFDFASKVLYSTDASMYQIQPLGVAIPKTQDDLIAAVEIAAKYKIPILPRGAGSSLGGRAIGEALILDCLRWLDSIIAIDPESHTATVEPGVVPSAFDVRRTESNTRISNIISIAREIHEKYAEAIKQAALSA